MGWLPRRNPKALGGAGEEAAARHLAGLGFEVVARNYRGAGGELDMICRDGDTLVFVEVKARGSDRFGGAPWAVPPAKRRQVAKVARAYLTERALYGKVPCRFDVVLIDAGRTPFGVTHIPGAFQADAD
ncbi:MAG: YraN family protein [Nitrospirae bacterium]|nr:YraN family protein [Nitrospirota bacterium]